MLVHWRVFHIDWKQDCRSKFRVDYLCSDVMPAGRDGGKEEQPMVEFIGVRQAIDRDGSAATSSPT